MPEQTPPEGSPHAPQPFWTLRGFVDSLFGIVAGAGFFPLVKYLVDIKNILEKSKEAKFTGWELLKHVAATGKFLSDATSFLLVAIVLVIYIDDYGRSRIVTYLAPCRSIGRIGLDIAISFFFALTFWLITIQSSFLFLGLACAFAAGAKWARITENQSHEWEQAGEPGPDEKSHWHKVKHWTSYRLRLRYILVSHWIAFCLFLVCFAISNQYDQDRVYWFIYPYFMIAFYLSFEAVRYFVEERIVREAQLHTGRSNFGVLKSVLYMPPKCSRKLRAWAHEQAQRNFAERDK